MKAGRAAVVVTIIVAVAVVGVVAIIATAVSAIFIFGAPVPGQQAGSLSSSPSSLPPPPASDSEGQDSLPQQQDGPSVNVSFDEPVNLTKNPADSVYGQVAAAQDGSVYVVWQESVEGQRYTDEEEDSNIGDSNYDIFMIKSADRGASFDTADAVNISRNPGFSEHPQIAVSADGGSIYVVWTDNNNNGSGGKQVMFAKSDDRGASFGTPVALGRAGSFNPEIAAAGDERVYVIWQEEGNGGSSGRIMLASSSDGGDSFSAPTPLYSDGSAGTLFSESFPKVAAQGDGVYAVWGVQDVNGSSSGDSSSNGNQSQSLLYSKSLDGGTTFSAPQKLNGGIAVGEAQVAAYRNEVHVVWGGLNTSTDSLFYVRSTDGGNSFSAPAVIKSGDSMVNPLNVELAVASPSSVYIAAQAITSTTNEDEIMLLSSTDGGRSFSGSVTNLSNNVGVSECPSISVSGNDMFVIWEDMPGDDEQGDSSHEILFAKGSPA
ncbi:sialidase family protein [Nitrososphaera sp.]|uniref:sialidase family protein n=1 Tax=Nitrososphaera sp. TaxID=1971748 RepID=UPI00307EB4A5